MVVLILRCRKTPKGKFLKAIFQKKLIQHAKPHVIYSRSVRVIAHIFLYDCGYSLLKAELSNLEKIAGNRDKMNGKKECKQIREIVWTSIFLEF